MSGKLIGLACGIILLLAAVLASWLTVDRGFPHQHQTENSVSDNVTFAENVNEVMTIRLYEKDYQLNEYLFRNLAGEMLPVAPVTYYGMAGDDAVLFLQGQRECILPKCEYAVMVSHDDNAEEQDLYFEERDSIVTFADYCYLDATDRKSHVVIRGNSTNEDIRREISGFEKSLYSYDYDSGRFGYKSQINVHCFVNYFLLYELAYPGNRIENTAMLYRDNNGKYCLCTSDFPESGRYMGDDDYHNLLSSVWFSMLLKSRDFTENVIREYEYQRNHCFSEEYLTGYVEDTASFLAQSGIVNDEELFRQKEELCDYLRRRLEWLDKNMISLKEFSALSAVKEYRNMPY